MSIFHRDKVERSVFLSWFLFVAIGLHVPSAAAQTVANQTDNGRFTVWTYITGGGSISAFATDPTPDSYFNYASYSIQNYPSWSLSGSSYSAAGVGSSFGTGPVPAGDTYTASFYYSVSYLYYAYYGGGPGYTCGVGNDGALCQGIDSVVGSASVYIPAPPPIPPDSCAVGSNPAAGFTSIVPNGINFGISGTFSVSFGGSEFAGFTPTVAYGPYSTPESIAANMAALLTREYARYGLTAKAFGRNVIYSGTATTSSGSGTLGLVSNVFSGGGGPSSFLADTSPAAATEAGLACESAPPPPPTSICESDPGTPRRPINVPARITQAKGLLSPQCNNKLAALPGYTTTKLFSTLNKALFCQYPNTPPQNATFGAYADTHVFTNKIDLLPNFYPPSLDDPGRAFTLIHEGIHLLGRGALPDSVVIQDLGLTPLNAYDSNVITRYITGGCNP